MPCASKTGTIIPYSTAKPRNKRYTHTLCECCRNVSRSLPSMDGDIVECDRCGISVHEGECNLYYNGHSVYSTSTTLTLYITRLYVHSFFGIKQKVYCTGLISFIIIHKNMYFAESFSFQWYFMQWGPLSTSRW